MKIIKRILFCTFGSHSYIHLRRLGAASHLVGCRDCHKRWGLNTDARAIVPWCLELEDAHRAMGHIAQ